MSNYLRGVFLSARFHLTDRKTCRLIHQVENRNLTYLDNPALMELAEQVKHAKRHLTGIYVEAGTALGGSAIVIAVGKPQKADLFLYDTFSQIPAPTEQDGAEVIQRYELIKSGKAEGLGENTYYGYQKDLLKQVRQHLLDFGLNPEEHRVHFVQGLFQDTMSIHQPVAFAHIDCDWYESVKLCLNQVIPNLQVGGTAIIDDYYHWSGCKLAVDEFISTYEKIGEYQILKRSRLQIKRVTATP